MGDPGRMLLAAKSLVVRAGRRVLLGPVDIQIRAGERIGVLGPSGSGKSLLLDRLMGLTPLAPGDGSLSSAASEGGAIGLRIAAVFQTNALFDSLTVRQNVAVGCSLSPQHSDVANRIRSVGLDPEVDGEKFPSELSGGMQRRVALARALAVDPDLLILDEPLVGLDGETRRVVIDTVKLAHAERRSRMAVLVVTHEYDFAASFCDRLFWIHPRERRLIEVVEWPGLDEARRIETIQTLLTRTPEAPLAAVAKPRAGLIHAGGQGIASVLRGSAVQSAESMRSTAQSLRELPGLVASLLHGPTAGARPGRDFLEHWVRACILALPYVALLFGLVGLLMVLQSERLLAPLGLASQIPEAATRAIVQGVGPLLLVLIMAGRTGSAMAADIGGQSLSRQIDMWRLLGRNPRLILFAPRAWALVVAFPLLLLLAEYVALGTGWLFYSLLPRGGLTASAFWEGVKGAWEFAPTLGGMIRAAIDGAILAVLAYLIGSAPKGATEDVADASTRTVVAATLAFVVVEVAWTALLGDILG